MKIDIFKTEAVQRHKAVDFPNGTLLTCTDSNGLFVRLLDGQMLGFRSFDAVPWLFPDDRTAIWLPAPKGAKITLEQK